MSSATTAKTAQLKCTAGRGMLMHETGVLIRGAERNYESILDSELVRVSEGQSNVVENTPAQITVNVVSVNCENILVELPRQVVSGGRRIWVPKTEVEM